MSSGDILRTGGITHAPSFRATGGLVAQPAAAAARGGAIGNVRQTEDVRNSPINWWLIAVALVYLALSYFFLAASIWFRLLFASYLILRMRADSIIPLCLSCLQLKLNFRESIADDFAMDGGAVAGLTGFESYAFAIPPLLISIRAAVALASARTDKQGFPFGLYTLWLCGAVFVVAGAFINLGSARGWTGGMRMYSIVGSIFYGLLMPRLSGRQVERLAGGVACVGMILFAMSIVLPFGSKVMFVLSPVCGAWAVSGLLSLAASRIPAASLLLFINSLPMLTVATFTSFGAWAWACVAAVVECSVKPSPRRPSRMIVWLVLATFGLLCVVFAIGLSNLITQKAHHDGTFWGRIEYKLYADRAPLWSACLQIILEEPSLIPTPDRPFMIEWFGEKRLWSGGPHNLALELVNQLGSVAGPISIIVLGYAVWSCTAVLARESNRGVQTLAIALISGVLVGGLTLPYMVQDRIAEFLFFAAGTAIASSWRGQRMAVINAPGQNVW